VSIVHFDAWHRATPNTSDRKRYMLKFQFARTVEPPSGEAADLDREHDRAVCGDVWGWLSAGGAARVPQTGEPIGPWMERVGSPSADERARAVDCIATSGAAGEALPALREALQDEAERVRLNAAYGLAAAGDVDTLAADLRREALASEDLATAKTADNAHGTNPTAPLAAHALAVAPRGQDAAADLLRDAHWLVRAAAAGALSNMGAGAVAHGEALLDATTDEHWWVRRNALEGLGRLSEVGAATVEAATRCLRDDDYRVRRNAAMALRHAPEPGPETVTALAQMLEDENRYNRFYAVDGLRRLAPASPEAETLLMDHLITSRWCPLTNTDSRY
jgi:HEAT repeat protein